MSPRPYTPDLQYREKDLGLLFGVLPSLRGLQRLTLGFIHWTLHQNETKRLLENNTWMALRFLSLRGFDISPDTFTVFVQNHTSTLTEVGLNHVGFPSGCRDTWHDLISRNKPFLKLKRAKFHVYEWETAEDGSDGYVFVAEDLLLGLLSENEENKDEKQEE